MRSFWGSIVFTLILFFLIFLPRQTFGQAEFGSSYKVTYEVSDDGSTLVTNDITLRNLTEKYYAAFFNLNLSNQNILEVSASDNQGNLEAKLEKEDGRSRIRLKFNQQVSGKDKTYNFKIKYKSFDFTQKDNNGVYLVTIPKVPAIENLEDYNLTLSMPSLRGDPYLMIPESKSQRELNGRLLFEFNRGQINERGVLAIFKTNQVVDFNLQFNIQNLSLFPRLISVPMPSDNDYQEILISDINPRPENVGVDDYGNVVAYFRLGRNEKMQIGVEGKANLYFERRAISYKALSKKEKEEYLKSDNLHQKNNPLIAARLKNILDGKEKSDKEKIGKINDYVVKNLRFDYERFGVKDLKRLGALTVLGTPDRALAAEFSDLFVTLARGAGIPSRNAVGITVDSDSEVRPLSFNDGILHIWPEYYIEGEGWRRADPTWENTGGGIDYFEGFDLGHLNISVDSFGTQNAVFTTKAEVEVSEGEFEPKLDLRVSVESPREVFGGFPASVKVVLENRGSIIQPGLILEAKGEKIAVQNNLIKTAQIPPFGKGEYEFNLRTSFLQSIEDPLVITAKIVDQGAQPIFTRQETVKVSPFFVFNFFPFMAILLIVGIILMYILTLALHIKQFNPTFFERKKKS